MIELEAFQKQEGDDKTDQRSRGEDDTDIDRIIADH
jgi:hypothetical protein